MTGWWEARPDQRAPSPRRALGAGFRGGTLFARFVILTGGGSSIIFVLPGDVFHGGIVPTAPTAPNEVPGVLIVSGTDVATGADNTQALIGLAGTNATTTFGPYIFFGSIQQGSSNVQTIPVYLVGTLAFAAPGVPGGQLVSRGPTLLPNGSNGFLLASTAPATPGSTSLFELQPAVAQPAASAIVDAATTTGMDAKVTADTNVRWRVRGDGAQFWGSGAAPADCELQRLSANRIAFTTADLAVHTAGRGLQVAEGSNTKQNRNVTLVAGSAVVANTAVTATSLIVPGYVTPSANPGALFVSSVTVGTGFTMKSTNGADTSVVGYEIFEPG